VSLCLEGHPGRDTYLNNLTLSLKVCFDHQGKPDDLDEAISLYEETLRLRPVGHESRDISLGNLGGALVTCFNDRGDIDDITQAISLNREILTLHFTITDNYYISRTLSLAKRSAKIFIYSPFIISCFPSRNYLCNIIML
jgi:hypothetical protein